MKDRCHNALTAYYGLYSTIIFEQIPTTHEFKDPLESKKYKLLLNIWLRCKLAGHHIQYLTLWVIISSLV